MDYQTSKIILWAMLSFPVLAFGIYMIFKLMDDIIGINKVKKAEYLAAREKFMAEEQARRKRARFDRNYDNYLNTKYSDADYESEIDLYE